MLTQTLYRWGRYAARRPWTVLAGWLVVAAVVVGSATAFGHDLEDSFGAPDTDSERATALLARAGSDRAGISAQVVLTPVDPTTTFEEPGRRAVLEDARESLAGASSVLSAAPVEVSPDGRVAVVRLHYPPVQELQASDLEQLKATAADLRTGSLRVETGGDLFFAFEEAESGPGEAAGLLVAAVVLLVAFGSVVAMGLSIGTALLGLGLGVAGLSVLAHLVDVPTWAPVIGSMVGLGVGIDYALLLLSRHRDHLAEGLEVPEAAGRALATAGRTVLFAGGTVVLAILGLVVAGVPFVTAGGIAVSAIVLLVVAVSLTLLPALHGLAGRRVTGRRPVSRGTGSVDRWRRWARHVTRHPKVYAAGGTAALLLLAAPALSMRLGIPDDGALAPDRTERRAYDLVAEGFGAGVNGPLVVAVDLTDDPSVVEPLRRAVAEDRGVASVGAAAVDRGAGVATVVVVPTTGPQEAATGETVERLRTEVLPTAWDDGRSRAHVGGPTATFLDLGAKVEERLPRLIAAVVLLSGLLLLLMFRSVLVPLKAATLNLLGIGASYGVMVAVFQWGWAADLVGLETTVPIVSFIPLFMFAILFGLSMDYEVFLMARVREEYDASGDATHAVVEGIASTARLITSAALIMVAVFLGFVVSDDPFTKMFGLGLATAIAIDATVVRMVLVPALMTLLGDAAWWLPRWLDRILPGRPASPARQPAPEPVGVG